MAVAESLSNQAFPAIAYRGATDFFGDTEPETRYFVFRPDRVDHQDCVGGDPTVLENSLKVISTLHAQGGWKAIVPGFASGRG